MAETKGRWVSSCSLECARYLATITFTGQVEKVTPGKDGIRRVKCVKTGNALCVVKCVLIMLTRDVKFLHGTRFHKIPPVPLT